MFWSRLKVFIIIIILANVVLAGQLAYLQLANNGQYRQEAESNLIRLPILLGTHRGSITDRNGIELAYDTPRFDVSMYYPFLAIEDNALLRRQAAREGTSAALLHQRLAPLWLDDAAFLARQADAMNMSVDDFRREMSDFWPKLSEAAGIPLEELDERRLEILERVHLIREAVRRAQGRRMIIREESYGTRSSIAHILKSDIDERTKAAVTAFRSRYGFLLVEQHARRSYPYGEMACHIVGYINETSVEEIGTSPLGAEAEPDELFDYRSGDDRGRSGIEASMEAALRGHRGKEQYDKSDRRLWREEPQPGQDVQLTIDSTLQLEVEAFLSRPPEMPAEGGVPRGAAVVIDIATGEILAMASTPRYNPNTLGSEYDQLIQPEAGNPFLHRALSAYDLGSIFKGVTATAALHEGKAGLQTQHTCMGQYDPRLPRFHCNNRSGHGTLDMVEAMRYSCNVYFYHLGAGLRTPKLAEWGRRFGFAQRTGIMLRGESAGKIDERTDPKNLAIGQGALLVTPLQAARFAAMLATGGRMTEVHLVRSPRPAAPKRIDMSLNQAYVSHVREMWAEVVSEQGGTGHRTVYSDRVSIAGKTGSAQNPHGPTHAWFVGFAPAENPQLAFAVFFENAGGGGTVAGPVAKQIVERALDLGLIVP